MEQLRIVKTTSELLDLMAYLQDKDIVAYDCETTGLSKDAEVIGFSVAAEADVAYYVVLAYWDVESKALVWRETREGATACLKLLSTKRLVMHNAVFDCWKAETNFNVRLIDAVHTDTMLLAHILDENRYVGLKELGASIFGDDAKKEQDAMKASILKNGGGLTKANYELYKADEDLIAMYGAKDTLLTLNLFYHFVPELFDAELDKFFYEEETMPLLKGPTYEMNVTGLKVDLEELEKLKRELSAECLEAKAFIYSEITPIVKDKYPATGKTNVFNIGSSKQLAWLLFSKLNNEFCTLTKGGKEMCKALDFALPYTPSAKRAFIKMCEDNVGKIYAPAVWNYKTKKMSRPKKIGQPWDYIACGKDTLATLSQKYKWVERYLEYAKSMKLLSTYVEGIQERAQYGIIRPSFLQHGTTSGRYSSRNPNFQNLPRKDKRVKKCIVPRPNKVFVGADYAQLEPRVFAYFSQDARLMSCFSSGDDFYSLIGATVFDKYDCSMKKDDADSFANKYPALRDIAKVVALSATYGTTAFKMAPAIGKKVDEAQDVIDAYFSRFPSVQKFMLECHAKAKAIGQVQNLFGRPRRLPEAMDITKIYGNAKHEDLPYNIRTMLNLAVNHTIQSTGASIMNRAMVAFYQQVRAKQASDPRYTQVRIVLTVHDEMVAEAPKELAEDIVTLMRDCMENTVKLPGVELVADPKIGKNLAELK